RRAAPDLATRCCAGSSRKRSTASRRWTSCPKASCGRFRPLRARSSQVTAKTPDRSGRRGWRLCFSPRADAKDGCVVLKRNMQILRIPIKDALLRGSGAEDHTILYLAGVYAALEEDGLASDRNKKRGVNHEEYPRRRADDPVRLRADCFGHGPGGRQGQEASFQVLEGQEQRRRQVRRKARRRIGARAIISFTPDAIPADYAAGVA